MSLGVAAASPQQVSALQQRQRQRRLALAIDVACCAEHRLYDILNYSLLKNVTVPRVRTEPSISSSSLSGMQGIGVDS